MSSLLQTVFIWGVVPFVAVFLYQLRGIPGPLLARITSKWLFVVELSGNRTYALHRLHQKYGSVVRIAPNEVSFSNIETIKQLYSPTTTFRKAPLYEPMMPDPIGVFSMTDRTAHGQRRKLLSHMFAQSHLLDTQPLILNHIQRLIDRTNKNLDRPLNVLLLFRLAVFDIVAELFVGRDQQALLADKPPQFVHDMDAHFILVALETNFPWLWAVLVRLPIKSLQHFIAARNRLVEYGRTNLEAYVKRYGRDSGRRDLLTKMISQKPDSGEAMMTDPEMISEIQGLIFAATDTTSTTLTYLFWELARNPSWQTRVRKELTSRGKETLPRFNEVDDLPALDAVIKETMRLHPSVPSSLWRQTPAGGKELAGHFIPEKTVVSMQCYTTQRNPTAFPRPDEFDPSRWMEPNVITSEMKELFMPFSHGSRACIGKNMAMMNLKLISGALLRQFEVKLSPTATEACMAMEDHFLMLPKGGKCELILSRAS